MNAAEQLSTDHVAEAVLQLHRVAAGRGALLGEGELRTVLESGGVRFAEAIAVPDGDVEAAVRAAERLDGPVVIKALVPGVQHKSELGHVRIGLRTAGDVRAAATDLLVGTHDPALATPVILSVQRQLTGVELSIGVRRDQLGLLCVVAAGGTLVELLADSACSLVPVTRDAARAMLRRLRIWPLLNGYRGSAPVDLEAVVDVIEVINGLAQGLPELAELEINPVFASSSGCVAADAAARLDGAGIEDAEGQGDGSGILRAIFAARRIAIVGGTSSAKGLGSLVHRYLLSQGYDGEVVTVSRTYESDSASGRFARVADVLGPIDLALIAAPAPHVSEIVRECIAADVRAGIVVSSGFGEVGEEGAELQRELVEAAGDTFRFLGPNSLGAIATHPQVCISFGMALERPVLKGPVGFVSQSGAFASALLSRAAESGVAFSHWISVGNEADLDIADSIRFLAAAPETTVICAYLEVIRRPQSFASACRDALAAGKPVVVIKAGRTEAGRRAAASHTAALAGTDAAYEALFESCGALRVDSPSQLLSAARGLLSAGAVRGDRIGVVTMSGGISTLIADAIADSGMVLTDLTPETQAAISAGIPPYGSSTNPVDVTFSATTSPELVTHAVRVLRRSGEVDLVLVQLGTNSDPGAEHMARDLVMEVSTEGPPLLIGRLGARDLAPRALEVYAAAGVHVFDWPENLVRAADACVRYGALRARTMAESS